MKLSFFLISLALLLGAVSSVQQSKIINLSFEYNNILEQRISRLETINSYLILEVATNRLLLKETQRMVIPNELALKEVVK